MSNKIWVVMQREYEYNDETYNSNDGGNVVIGYTTHAAAKVEADRLNTDTFRKEGGYMYLGYEAYENFDETEELSAFLESLGDTERDEREFYFEDLGDYHYFEEIMSYLKSTTDEEIMIFVNALKNPQYYVEEVEVSE